MKRESLGVRFSSHCSGNNFKYVSETLYNINKITGYQQGETIKNQEILSIVSEISETLSLTNKPKQILETSLDTLSEILDTDCCWIQLVKLGNGKLPLVSFRGMTTDMQRELALMDLEHRFSHEIVGLGHSIVIHNLSRDGNYDIPIFEKEGFHSLIAVPIMTYRIHGVMGVAYRDRRKFDRDFPKLLSVIANLIGMSLSKSTLDRQPREKQKQPENNEPVRQEPGRGKTLTEGPSGEPESAVDTGLTGQTEKKRPVKDFKEHIHRMKTFNSSHKSL